MIAWRKRQRDKKRKKQPRQKLRFSPHAWAKLRFLRDVGQSEVGGFGISHPDNPLLVEDFQLVKQTCTPVTVEFDDMAVADFFEDQVDHGRRPDQFGRIWIHTHPGSCPLPSGTDEETFQRCFSSSDWAVMFIVAQSGARYARLRFNVGPHTSKRLGVGIDWGTEFRCANHDEWLHQYEDLVRVHDPFASRVGWPVGDTAEPWSAFGDLEEAQSASDWVST